MRAKKYFGDDHEIMYDSVMNHDAYAFLRITLDVPRGQDTESIINLNNKPIGKVRVIREGTKTVGYEVDRDGVWVRVRELGQAVAAAVSGHIPV